MPSRCNRLPSCSRSQTAASAGIRALGAAVHFRRWRLSLSGDGMASVFFVMGFGAAENSAALGLIHSIQKGRFSGAIGIWAGCQPGLLRFPRFQVAADEFVDVVVLPSFDLKLERSLPIPGPYTQGRMQSQIQGPIRRAARRREGEHTRCGAPRHSLRLPKSG